MFPIGLGASVPACVFFFALELLVSLQASSHKGAEQRAGCADGYVFKLERHAQAIDFKTYEGAASTSDGHRLPTSATNAPKSRPGPARSVTGTNKEFSAATHALLTPSSGFSSARTVMETAAPGSSEPEDGAASTQAGNEENAHDCIASDSFFKTNWTSLTVSDKDA